MLHIERAEAKHTGTITGILDKVTLRLHEKGVRQWTYPWDSGIIEAEAGNGNVYLLLEDDIAVGTFSIKAIESINDFRVEPGSMYLYRIAILPEYQGKNLGAHVTDHVMGLSQRLDKAVYLDCWAGNSKLRSFYLKAGFEHLGDFPEEDYCISIFRYGRSSP